MESGPPLLWRSLALNTPDLWKRVDWSTIKGTLLSKAAKATYHERSGSAKAASVGENWVCTWAGFPKSPENHSYAPFLSTGLAHHVYPHQNGPFSLPDSSNRIAMCYLPLTVVQLQTPHPTLRSLTTLTNWSSIVNNLANARTSSR